MESNNDTSEVPLGLKGVTPHPEVFTIPPPQPKEKKPGQLTSQQVHQFFDEGYVLVENYFQNGELEACKEAVNGLVDECANKLYNGGKIKKLYKELGLFKRLTAIEKEFPGANIVFIKSGKMPQAFRDLYSNERLLNAIEQLIGPDIMGHPVWNLRTKTPRNEATTVPWHQDISYLDNSSYDVLQPAAWIPLLDSNENNGCMQFVRKGHQSGRVCEHECCAGDTWYTMLREEEMEKTLGVNLEEDIVSVPVPYGGMVLLNNLIPHRSLNNYSDDIRWSLDLRWQSPSKPVGFHGLKEGILLRSSQEPNLKIDWDPFVGVNRNKEQTKSVGMEVDDFDTTIVGPWMKKWKIVHHNRHTKKMTKENLVTWHL
ncbi:uncharacterized protein LOC106167021 [Lingula anatina]|uniref:Uncharacterized protein LOC106158539 n=1 Tax=Lingula anatina TaxID=7574 RepID=A0A1S3HWV5_LINAN|nr:uncharacterized protein LOC106158539 [Lingula anatina]XP_013401146.1 uncharacterized protein LOC106167021 [Lingula anatina]XP_013401147.1 uncharacterized protein LOC106167021 [Lingula anatina]|eukprot:XP_013390036.1 uncharacterized protein LOC106158539 [Lingula anatina]